MAFNGTEGLFITTSEGAALTKKYRDDYLSGDVKREAIFFGKDKLEEILAQPNCEGLRIYFGAVEETERGNTWDELELVIVGADSNENDQLGEGQKILDSGRPCPPDCSTTNALNS